MNRDRIKAILLAHGFRVPEGMTDLKPYVYEAVEAVLAEAGAPEGWRLVPEHPTPEMLAALRIGSRRDSPSDELCEIRFRAMLANVPELPVRAENTSGERVRSEPQIEHEPVAWMYDLLIEGDVTPDWVTTNEGDIVANPRCSNIRPLCAHPPALRLPEPMTDGELNAVSIRLRDDLLDHIYEYGTAAEGILPRVLALCRAIEAETLRRVKEVNNG